MRASGQPRIKGQVALTQARGNVKCIRPLVSIGSHSQHRRGESNSTRRNSSEHVEEILDSGYYCAAGRLLVIERDGNQLVGEWPSTEPHAGGNVIEFVITGSHVTPGSTTLRLSLVSSREVVAGRQAYSESCVARGHRSAATTADDHTVFGARVR